MTSVPVPIATTPSRVITIRPWALPVDGSQMTADGSRRPSGIGMGSKGFRNDPMGMSVQARVTRTTAVRPSMQTSTARPRYW